MTATKKRHKRVECLHHRQMVYGKALDSLIEGQGSPNYVKLRWEKLKEVSK